MQPQVGSHSAKTRLSDNSWEVWEAKRSLACRAWGLRHGWQLQYLAGVVVVKPALQVDGVPAWHQAAVLENPQFSRGVVACGDDFMEGVFQRHRVVVSSLVLKDQQGGREGCRPTSISSKNTCCRSSWTNNWGSKRVDTEYICTLFKQMASLWELKEKIFTLHLEFEIKLKKYYNI